MIFVVVVLVLLCLLFTYTTVVFYLVIKHEMVTVAVC